MGDDLAKSRDVYLVNGFKKIKTGRHKFEVVRMLMAFQVIGVRVNEIP